MKKKSHYEWFSQRHSYTLNAQFKVVGSDPTDDGTGTSLSTLIPFNLRHNYHTTVKDSNKCPLRFPSPNCLLDSLFFFSSLSNITTPWQFKRIYSVVSIEQLQNIALEALASDPSRTSAPME